VSSPLPFSSALKKASAFQTYASLSTTIDRLLGGGYKAGTITEVFGGSNTGKTQITMQAVLSLARMGLKSIFVDTEGAFRPERIEGIARSRGWNPDEILERIVYIRAVDSTQQREVVRRLSEKDDTAACRLVAVDTLTENFSLDFPGSQNLPRRQGAIAAHLSEMARDAFLNGRAYVLANRVVLSQNGGEGHVGGRTVDQMVHAAIYLVREGGKVRARLAGVSGSGILATLGQDGFD